MSHKFFDLTFTTSVKQAQEHYGTRRHYVKFEAGEADFFGLTEFETEFISTRDSFYLATVARADSHMCSFGAGRKDF